MRVPRYPVPVNAALNTLSVFDYWEAGRTRAFTLNFMSRVNTIEAWSSLTAGYSRWLRGVWRLLGLRC